MFHTKDGYEFSADGQSRIFFTGDPVVSFIGKNSDVIHRRYLEDGCKYTERGYKPSLAVQTEEHHAIFDYDANKFAYALARPENAIIETGNESQITDDQSNEEDDRSDAEESETEVTVTPKTVKKTTRVNK